MRPASLPWLRRSSLCWHGHGRTGLHSCSGSCTWGKGCRCELGSVDDTARCIPHTAAGGLSTLSARPMLNQSTYRTCGSHMRSCPCSGCCARTRTWRSVGSGWRGWSMRRRLVLAHAWPVDFKACCAGSSKAWLGPGFPSPVQPSFSPVRAFPGVPPLLSWNPIPTTGRPALTCAPGLLQTHCAQLVLDVGPLPGGRVADIDGLLHLTRRAAPLLGGAGQGVVPLVQRSYMYFKGGEMGVRWLAHLGGVNLL